MYLSGLSVDAFRRQLVEIQEIQERERDEEDATGIEAPLLPDKYPENSEDNVLNNTEEGEQATSKLFLDSVARSNLRTGVQLLEAHYEAEKNLLYERQLPPMNFSGGEFIENFLEKTRADGSSSDTGRSNNGGNARVGGSTSVGSTVKTSKNAVQVLDVFEDSFAVILDSTANDLAFVALDWLVPTQDSIGEHHRISTELVAEVVQQTSKELKSSSYDDEQFIDLNSSSTAAALDLADVTCAILASRSGRRKLLREQTKVAAMKNAKPLALPSGFGNLFSNTDSVPPSSTLLWWSLAKGGASGNGGFSMPNHKSVKLKVPSGARTRLLLWLWGPQLVR